MAATETDAETSRVLKWLTASTLFFLVALIAILTALAEAASPVVILSVFGTLLIPAVFILPVWAVWGLSDEDGH